MKTDIQIARETPLQPIGELARRYGIDEQQLIPYGKYIAKLPLDAIDEERVQQSHLILMTAMSPTKSGIGKTTVSIGLSMALNRLGKISALALREPSMGPCFGMKGGAAGGGYSQVLPMEKINLHFTGDFHAVTSANNLIAALVDNYIFRHQGQPSQLKTVFWRRVLDMNDRALRTVVTGLGDGNGVVRESGFDITPASEIMAILCLANDIDDLRRRVENILLGITCEGKPFYMRDLGGVGAVMVVLMDALQPNLVQTTEHTAAFIHGGPFANIAHGCNSVLATKMAMSHSDYVVTEAGFAADLGAEKFFDIKCRMAGLRPSAVVVVATVRALKYHGGVEKAELNHENLDALEKGLPNLLQHVENIQKVYGLPCVVAVNAFPTDTEAELRMVEEKCRKLGVNVALSEVWAKGGEGGMALAEEVVRLCEQPNDFHFCYEDSLSIAEKINAIAKKVYHADGADLVGNAPKQLKQLEALGFGSLPVCMAKTQYSFSDDPTKLGAPRDFRISVRNLKVAAGAGFVVALTGDIMTMPGLPKSPAAERIDVDENGVISGLF